MLVALVSSVCLLLVINACLVIREALKGHEFSVHDHTKWIATMKWDDREWRDHIAAIDENMAKLAEGWAPYWAGYDK